ncbi:MAG: hypothetical protein ABJ275_03745 [Maricaulaceae bacterium]
MRAILKILALLFAIAAIFLTASFYLGHRNGAITLESPARLGFQIYGGLSALLALIFGLWARAKDKTNRLATSRSAKFSIVSGVLSLTALIGLSFFG